MLCQEVHISPVHAIEMFSKENWNLHCYDIDDCKHIGHRHVGDDKEQGTIDTLHSSNCIFLTKVDYSKNQSN